MFNIGDLIIYSAHGICKIDDICEKTVVGITKTYYVLHPIDNHNQLKISIPVTNDKVAMRELMCKEQTDEVLELFKNPATTEWIDNPNKRQNLYSKIVDTGDRREIANVVNMLIRKKLETERNEKKFSERDRKLLDSIQNVLFMEFAISLNISFEDVTKMVTRLIKGKGLLLT